MKRRTPNSFTKLTRLLGISRQDEVKFAVGTELGSSAAVVPLRHFFATLRAGHPLPLGTGKAADKAFFDDLSGGL